MLITSKVHRIVFDILPEINKCKFKGENEKIEPLSGGEF